MRFEPDYRHFADVMRNVRPARLPIYEHIISPNVMELVLDAKFANLIDGDRRDLDEFFRLYCGFFREMTYDTVSFEVSSRKSLPGPHALEGGKGVIQTRADFESYAWGEIAPRFWESAGPKYDAMVQTLPPGMKAVGGIGNGVFEFTEDLVGLQYLPYIQADDPELYSDLFDRVGDVLLDLWQTFLDRYKDSYAACRFGDDLGFKSSLLTNPTTIRDHIIPQYQRIIGAVRNAGKPFLLHCCGKIFDVMEDLIAAGIDAKHSNEDAIAPFDEWIERYGDRIGLLGGFDMHFLCTKSPDEIFETAVESGRRFRATAKGYALGSGNSIPIYVPVENYLAMTRAAKALREEE